MKKHYLPAEMAISSEMQQLSVCANARVPAEQEATSKAAEATKEVGGDNVTGSYNGEVQLIYGNYW